MIIECKRCHSKFNLDEGLLKDEGSKVRCCVCKNVFWAYPPQPTLDIVESPTEKVFDSDLEETTAIGPRLIFKSLTVDKDIHSLLKDINIREQKSYGSSSSSPILSSSGYGGAGYSGGGGGCFIATAAYGTRFSKQLYILERFRNTVLFQNTLGQKLIRSYYVLSPPVADYIRGRPAIRRIVRTLLVPLVWIIERFSDPSVTCVGLMHQVSFHKTTISPNKANAADS